MNKLKFVEDVNEKSIKIPIKSDKISTKAALEFLCENSEKSFWAPQNKQNISLEIF